MEWRVEEQVFRDKNRCYVIKKRKDAEEPWLFWTPEKGDYNESWSIRSTNAYSFRDLKSAISEAQDLRDRDVVKTIDHEVP